MIIALAACGRLNVDAMDAPGIDVAIDSGLPGLTAYYPMDDDPSDGVIDDVTGNARVARCIAGVSCPTSVPGHRGNALAFSGAHYARVVYGDWLSTPAAWSYASWVYLDSLADQVAFAKPWGAGQLDAWGLVAWNNGSGTCVESVDGASTNEAVCGPALLAGRWFHVAARWTGASKALFIDGTKVGELANATVSMNDSHDVTIGCDENAGMQVYFWHGKLDDLQFYDRALSDSEIAMLASQ